MFEGFLVSTGIVAIAEIGDKTQLLTIALAIRYRKAFPLIAGITAATLANHALAAALGHHVSNLLNEHALLWILGISFLAMAAWTLIPDSLNDSPSNLNQYGPFITSFVAFFIAEMADKTQIATVMLAAQFSDFLPVLAGTTLGMLIANVPVIFISNYAADRLPLKLIRSLASLGFLLLGLYSILQAISWTT